MGRLPPGRGGIEKGQVAYVACRIRRGVVPRDREHAKSRVAHVACKIGGPAGAGWQTKKVAQHM